MLNEKLHNRQRIDTFHTPSKLARTGASPERRTPEPERSATPTPRENQYGLRLADLVNTWNEDTRKMLREELAATRPDTPRHSAGTSARGELRDESLSTLQILQSILLEFRALTPLPHCDHCGALGRVAINQEDLTELVRGHLLMDRSNSRSNTSPMETSLPEPRSETKALQPLLTELTTAFGEMQQALKGSAALVEEVRRARAEPPPRSAPAAPPAAAPAPAESAETGATRLFPELDAELVLQDLRQIKDLVAQNSTVALTAEVQALKEALNEVQQKSEKDSQTLLRNMERLSDVISAERMAAAREAAESMPATQQNQKAILNTLQQVSELISVDHTAQVQEAHSMRQSVTSLDLELKRLQDSVRSSLEKSNEELLVKMKDLEESLTVKHQEAEQKSAERLDLHHQKVEHIHEKADRHSSAVDELKQEVSQVKDQLVDCNEKLQKAPKQAQLTEAVRRTFEQMSTKFHQECEKLYMRPSFQVSFPEALSQDVKDIKDGIELERAQHTEQVAKSQADLGRLEQELRRTEQGVAGLDSTVKSSVVSELQHLQDIFAMLEGNFLMALRKQLDKATAAFSSTQAQFRSSLKHDLEHTLKDSKVVSAHGEVSGKPSQPGFLHGPRVIELAFMMLTLLELAMHMTNAFLELKNSERFLLALAAVLGPCLLNSVVILLFVNFLVHELGRWMNANWSHAQRLLAFSILRPDWLRFFALYAPSLRSTCGPWERRYWEEVLQARTTEVEQECDELRLALQNARKARSKVLITEEEEVLPDEEEQERPEVPLHREEALHGAAPEEGTEGDAVVPVDVGAGPVALDGHTDVAVDVVPGGAEEAPQAVIDAVQQIMRRPCDSGLSGASPRGPKPVLRSREWENWLRTHSTIGRTEVGEDHRDGDGKLFEPSGLRKVYGVVPDPPSQGEPTRSVLKPGQLRHSCLLCGMSPGRLEKKEVWQYKRVICLATLISALYNDLPKVLLCIWLLPTNESLESWFLRIAIVAINGLYVLWALLLSFWTFFEPMPEGHALVQISLKDAAVEVWEESVEVRWSYPRKKQTAPVPDEFICAVQPLGEPQPSLVRRVRHDGSDLSCTFGALQPDYPYSVLLAPAHRGVLLGRPLRIACRTLPRALPLEPESLCLRRCGPSWAEISWTGAQGTAAAPPMDLLLELSGDGLTRSELAPGPVHRLWGLKPQTEYQVGLKLPHDPREPALRLSFVTALEEDEAVSGVMTSLTTLRKDLAEIKRTVCSLDANAANAEVVRQLGTLQERWAGLQVSCLTGEVQKLVESNEELKKDLSEQLKPVLAELRGVQDAILQ